MRLVTCLVAASLMLSGCAGTEEAGEAEDPSKLSAELEARASEIEQKADAAAAEVEREAAQELAQLQAEAREADVAEEDVSADQEDAPVDQATPAP